MDEDLNKSPEIVEYVRVSKREKPEELIGKFFNNGKLKVVGIMEKELRGGPALFKVVCSVCSNDPELFPDGYFLIRKGCLEAGLIPCGCGKHYKWKEWQYLLKADRAAKVKNFTVNGIVTAFNGVHTKISCKCNIDSHEWTPTLNNIINNKMGCPKCSGSLKYTEQEALQKCIDICREMGYIAVGFVDGYKGVRKTKFKYICPEHDLQISTYFDLVTGGSRCPLCAETGYNPNKRGSFYIVKWTKDGHSFIKFGITNRKVETRVAQQACRTEYRPVILFKRSWENGETPLKIEKQVKNSGIRLGVVDKKIFADGFSETTDISCLGELLGILLQSKS